MARGSKRLRGKSWQLRVYLGKGQYEERTLPAVGGKPLGAREAERELRKLIGEAEQSNSRGRGQTVADLLKAYMAAKAVKWSAGTLETHRRIVENNLVPLLGDVTLPTILREPERIDGAYNHLRARGLAESTVARTHVVLHAAFELARRRRWLPANPVDLAERPVPDEVDPKAPPVKDVKRVLAALADYDLMLYTLVFFDANTGARRGELCALRWSHLDLDDGEVVISRAIAIGGKTVGLVDQPTKTKKGRRIALGPNTVEALRAWHKDRAAVALACGMRADLDDGYVFSMAPPPWEEPPHPTSIGRRLRLLRERHKLPAVTLQALRKFVATQLLDLGESIKTGQGRLGHARASTFADTYASHVPASDRRAAHALEELLG